MKRLIAVLTLASALGGCYGYPPPPSPPPPAPPVPRHPPADACGAGGLQYLTGRPVADLPPTVYRQQRVIPQGPAYDEPYVADRLTVLYNPRDGRITRVRCG